MRYKSLKFLFLVNVRAVNLSVPEEVDADLTKEVLQKYNVQAAGSLVSSNITQKGSWALSTACLSRHNEGHP